MRFCALLLCAALSLVAIDAYAVEGLPSQAMLAEMGLSDIQVMTDSEATAIRGSGFVLDVNHPYILRLTAYQLKVDAFRAKTALVVPAGLASYDANVQAFHDRVSSFVLGAP